MASIQFSFGNGIAVKPNGHTILLDPKVADFFSFVSHAHADHVPRDIISKPYCTKETCELISARDPNFEAKTVKYGKPINLDGISAKLISAGHILGSSQVLIEADGTSVLYTGDIKLSKGLTSGEIEIPNADTLIIEATYGKPSFKFPSIEDVRREMIRWVMEQNKKGFSVNLGGYHIGKSQEAIKILNESGIVPQVSESIRKYCNVYNDFDAGLEFLEKGEESKVMVSPMHNVFYNETAKTKCCALTGWSISRYGRLQGFPLSDHCDFPQLIDFVKQVSPKKVFCVHGYSKELAKSIRSKLGIPAVALERKSQKSIIDF
jgi:Cft2 family RNA processing exonuclease